LLLSSTNIAVDLGILAVDDALKDQRSANPPVIYRFGSKFDTRKFNDRRHLIPLRDKTLIERLRQLYEIVPNPAEAAHYLEWKKQRDRLREAIRKENLEFLSSARLVAMTTTLAAHDYSSLGHFDLVVFDEGSQVGKAHAISFAPLGSKTLYAGDPNQLAPIAQAGSQDALMWLGKSPFDWIERPTLAPATCMLDEQWRMADPISRSVSELFYKSQLRVAVPAAQDPAWTGYRTAVRTDLLGGENVILIDTEFEAQPARRFRGYECPEAAKTIAALVVDHVVNWRIENAAEDIIILTPYRAQRRGIENELRSVNASASLVSTVHRAQGTERRIVIFDPVCPTAEFVAGEAGVRLINVAFSRAKCRLIVMLQRRWQDNPVLLGLAERHRPIKLRRDAVEKLLLNRLPNEARSQQARQSPPGQSRSIPNKPMPHDPLDEFRRELQNRCPNGCSRRHAKQVAIELLDKLKFSKINRRDVDAAIDSVVLR
jgi:hypothetical protein